VKYQGWVRKTDESVVLFRMSIEREGEQFQLASVPVEDKILDDAELNPPDDQLGTALVLEVAQDIEQAVAEGSIPLADPTAEYSITPVPEARVREIIAADDTTVVHAGGLVFSFEQIEPGDGARATG
jgi:hypothetical protein